MRTALPFLPALMMMAGCQSVPREAAVAMPPAATPAAPPLVVQGSAMYFERIAVPGAQLDVVVIDEAAADAPAPAGDATIARAHFDDLPGPPYAFSLELDRASLRPGARYGLRASLRDARGQLAFMTPKRVTIDVNKPVELRLVRTPRR